MAQIKYNEIQVNQNVSSGPSFFTLKNDGDEAIVRIMHDSIDTFDVITTHTIRMNNKFRKVSCIRTPNDPVSACPFCNAGEKVLQRIFIHLIQYERQDDGKVIGIPKVWERSIQYANKLKDLIMEYGPLSDCIFKIKRSGAAGSMDTEYSIMFGNPSVYSASIYTKNDEAFTNYSALGTIVLDKTADEMDAWLTTGSFPQNFASTTPPPVSTEINVTADEDLPWINSRNAAPNMPAPVMPTPVNNNSFPNIQRPVRKY